MKLHIDQPLNIFLHQEGRERVAKNKGHKCPHCERDTYFDNLAWLRSHMNAVHHVPDEVHERTKARQRKIQAENQKKRLAKKQGAKK